MTAIPQYSRLDEASQRIVDCGVGQLYDYLRSNNLILIPDAHVLPLSEAVAQWIIESGNRGCLARRPGPTAAADASKDLMEWWRVSRGADPTLMYAGLSQLASEEGKLDT